MLNCIESIHFLNLSTMFLELSIFQTQLTPRIAIYCKSILSLSARLCYYRTSTNDGWRAHPCSLSKFISVPSASSRIHQQHLRGIVDLGAAPGGWSQVFALKYGIVSNAARKKENAEPEVYGLHVRELGVIVRTTTLNTLLLPTSTLTPLHYRPSS